MGSAHWCSEQNAGVQAGESAAQRLPLPTSSLLGRSEELSEALCLLASHRLLTLVGPGGAGKTRLALEVARAARPPLVGYVELAGLRPDEAVAPAVLAGCGIRDEPGRDPVSRLVEQLAPATGLLVLDNCEHVLSLTAALIDELLRRCAGVHVLTTSRVSLGCPDEVLLPVEGLTQIDDAVSLFLDRARRVRPDLPDSDATRHASQEIALLSDGLPLVLELAAAHARFLTLEDIRAGMAHQLDFLHHPRTTRPERHRSVEASIRWSLALVGEQERSALRALSILDGRFTLSAALAVAGGSGASCLQTLVDHCLVQFDPGDGRYVLLDTLRAYSTSELAKAGEVSLAHRRLLVWVACLARSVAPGLERADGDALQRVDREGGAVRAALRHASRSRQGLAAAADIVADLAFSWSLRGRCSEGRELAAEVSAALDEPHLRLVWAHAFLSMYAGNVEQSVELALQAVGLAAADDNAVTRARALILVGMAQSFVEPAAAVPVLESAADIAAAVGEDWAQVEALQVLAYGYQMRADHHAVIRCADRTVAALERLRHPQLQAWDAALRAESAARTGSYREAELTGRLALTRAMSVQEPVSAVAALTSVVRALVARGAAAEAAVLVEQLRPFFQAHPGLGTALAVDLARLLPLCWRDPAGSQSAVLRVHQEAIAADLPATSAETASLLAAARLANGDETGARAAAREALRCGAPLSSPQVTGEAVFALCAADRAAPQAVEQVHAALERTHAAGLWPLVLDGLDLEAALAVDAGRYALAARLHAVTDRWRGGSGAGLSPLAQTFRPGDADAVAAHLDAGQRESAVAAGGNLDLGGAVRLALRSRGRRGRPRAGWDSLTPTERDVVQLVAQGLSNAAVGTRLLMGTGTVRTHLRSVFAKLEVKSRAELAAQAARRERPPPPTVRPRA